MKYPIKILFAITLLTSISFSIINDFFTLVAIKKEVKEPVLGIIISSYSVFVIAITPFISGIVEKFSRRKIFLFTLFLQVNTTFYFRVCKIKNDFLVKVKNKLRYLFYFLIFFYEK
jgi:predicted MFS family arabinose efflux permease